MNFDKKLLALLSKARFEFILTIFAGISVGIFTIVQSKTLSGILNAAFLENKKLDQLYTAIIVFFIYGLFKGISVWLQKIFATKTSTKIKTYLRTELSRKIFELGPVFSKKTAGGKLNAIINEGVEKLDAYFSAYLPQFFLANIIPFVILIFVFPIDFISGIVFLLTGPVIPFFMILIGKQAENLSKKQWKTLNFLSSHFFDVIQGLTTLKIFGQSKNQIKKISEISDEFRKATLGVLKVAFLSALVLELLSTISIAIVSVEVGLRLLYGKVEFYDAFFVLLLAPEFYLPMRLLGSSFHAGIDGVTASKSIFEILDSKIPSKESSIVFERKKNPFNITFRNVSFAYRENTEVLNNINFEINPGEKVALVGKSGAGKSTILNLLLKFIEPISGEILVDDKPLKKVSRNSWLANVTYLSQQPYLFHGTVRNNLLIAKKDATEEELFKSLKFVNIFDFILNSPQGLDTNVGEGGLSLSGGQIQRIALARAYLKNSPILVLDEPTANLDPEVEEEISNKIYELMTNKTVITIAHRLNTITRSDKIILIEKGEIAAIGKHNELSANNKLYSDFLKYYEAKK